MDEKITIIVSVGGLLASIVLIGLVFATGSTFGQRCSDMGYTDTKHSECVTNLSKGKVVNATTK
jgi:hypothetical protein